MASLYPGCRIYPLGSNGTGSLCCFLTKADKQRLYALTAKHVVGGTGVKMCYGANTVFGEVVEVTAGSEADDTLDAALIELNEAGRRSIDIDSFSARVGPDRFDFMSMAKADSGSYVVRHAGATSAGKNPNKPGGMPGNEYRTTLGTVDTGDHAGPKGRVTLSGRRTREGDSGGPVFTTTGTLVAFVSVGLGTPDADGWCQRTRVMLVSEAVAGWGMQLASWDPFAPWIPAARAGFDTGGWVNPWKK